MAPRSSISTLAEERGAIFTNQIKCGILVMFANGIGGLSQHLYVTRSAHIFETTLCQS